MFSHLVIGSNDVGRSQKFYDALFTALGGNAGNRIGPDRVVYMHNGGILMVTKPLDGEPATHANGGTIGITASSPDAAKAWHDAGIANGGTTCENPPGVRDMGATKSYLAYLRDPDGNKLCAVYRYPAQ